MSYQNVQFKNGGNDEGDVLNFFNTTLRNLVQKNSGDNTFSIVAEECHDKDAPVLMNTKTKLRLTHSAHTISQIEKGFIRAELELKLKFGTTITGNSFKTRGSGHLNYIFVGFKDAVEVISESYFWVDGKLVDSYHQQDMVRESFAYNSIRSKDAKKGTPHSHSLWEDVMNMSPNVCGCYIPLEKFEGDAKVDVKIELVIPFTDQLALQAWRLYPNRILGEMEEEVKFCTDGLVWCQIPPKRVGEIKKFWDFNAATEYNAPDLPITNHFTQIGNEAVIVKSIAAAAPNAITKVDSNFKASQYETFSSIPLAATSRTSEKYTVGLNKLQLEESGCRIKTCKTNCAGFGIKDDVNNSIFELLNEPIIIPAQELTRYQFEGHAETNGFTSLSKSVPLRNATNITMMFPTHGNDMTVFQNIMYQGVRLVVNKKTYPETDFDNTYDGRFVAYQLMANELDGYIEPTREFFESISRPRNALLTDSVYIPSDSDKVKDGARYLMCPFDNTSFGINFQLERGNAGYVFDGIDTGSHSVTIEFRGKPISQTEGHDPYLYPDLKMGANDIVQIGDKVEKPPPPEMWICSDTYWTWSIQDGVRYYQRGIPAGYD